ncbi:MAG: hypothetical protein ABSD74_05485 [Rhizomicrobium sp.]|jgi:hypothetical protein
MNRFLIACSLATLCATGGIAWAQTGSMSSPSQQDNMSQQAPNRQMSSGQMSGGQMAAQPANKKKKTHPASAGAMTGGTMSGPNSGGSMASPPADNQGSMSSPH